jgi:prepilin-type processing-associated H-X9-DG protein
LVGLLLPALSSAREQANQLKCLSNVRQIVQAFVAYSNDNQGWLPSSAPKGDPTAPQGWWVDWRSNPATGLFNSDISFVGVGPYLKLTPTNVDLLRCPSDTECTSRVTAYGVGCSLSYSMNWAFGSQTSTPSTPVCSQYGRPAAKLVWIRNPSEKVLIIEETDKGTNTIDDGSASLFWANPTKPGSPNLLADRHDLNYRNITDPALATVNLIPNSKAKGNAGFCDGHAEYTDRRITQSRYHTLANAQTDALNAPEVTFK